MLKVNKNYDFSRMKSLMFRLEEDHSSATLNALKKEINTFFKEAKCREVLYTDNTDKLFFGMRVYPVISSEDVLNILATDKAVKYDEYYVEIDSKLTNPMLTLTEDELVAILLHEIGHIVYDTNTTDEVKKHIDMYMVDNNDNISIKDSKNYRGLIAYALKDSVMKAGSLFSKFGNTEIMADSFVVSCGFGYDLESAIKKISTSTTYINRDVDNRFIALSWTLRLYKEVSTKRLPAIRTLNKAKSLAASELEKRELKSAINSLNKLEDFNEAAIISEGFLKNKLKQFKVNGIKSIKNDVYSFNLRLRTIETEDDALLLIRNCNYDISILEDYLEDEISDEERESVHKVLQELYTIRQKAAKESKIKEKNGSLITVVYPDLSK